MDADVGKSNAPVKSTSHSLEDYRIPGLPSSMYYLPNFITPEEETHILSCIPPNKWVSLSHRRLQAIPAQLSAKNVLVATSDLPSWLVNPVVERFIQLFIFADAPHGRPNHCLINEYLPGQGIMPHEDGAAYYPIVSTVSLGGSVALDVTAKQAGILSPGEHGSNAKAWRILQEPRSLLVTTAAAYTDTLHGIAEVTEDVDLCENLVANWELLGDQESIVRNHGRLERTTRISLTFRDVLKESKLGSKIFGRPKP